MPIITRSQNKKQQQQQQEDSEYEISVHYLEDKTRSGGKHRAIRRVKITTPSFIEASTRTYKVYSANIKPIPGIKQMLTVDAAEEAIIQAAEAAEVAEAAEAADAAEVLVSLQNTTSADTSCMNPMTQVSVYMYRIAIYNISQTVHYKTAYILYDKKSRLYHVYSIVSNQIHATNCADDGGDAGGAHNASTSGARTEFTLPLPTNTIQFTYKSYIEDTITNFIMTMIVPTNAHDYYIQDDIFGLVIHPSEFQAKAFNEDSCYYDIDDIVYDQSSSDTTSGFKAFILIPSRHFWYWPASVAATAMSSSSYNNNIAIYHDNRYTSQILNSVLTILSSSG